MGEIARPDRPPVPQLSGRRPLERNRLSGPLDQVRADAAYLVREGHRRGLVVTQTEVESRGDQVVMDVNYYPRPPKPSRILVTLRSWGWKPWTAIGVGALIAFGMAMWAVVVIVKAVLATVVLIATAALGAIVLLGFLALVAAAKGGGTWSGSGTWN